MNSNFRLFFGIMAVGAIMFSGCSDEEKELPIENVSIVEGGNVQAVKKVENDNATAILGSGGSMSSVLSQTFINIVEVDRARHIVVACDDLETYQEEIQMAYMKGAVITVIDPDASKLDAWCEANGMVYAGDPTSANAYALVSFNRKASSISIQKGKQKDGIDEEEVPLVIFTNWLDKLLKPNALTGTDLKSRDIKKRFAPQHVSHVFPLELSREVLEQTNWAVPDDASLTTTAEFNCDIYPIHSFADNDSFSGDIYAVEAELTIHNGNLFNGKWQYNRGNHLYEVCGFYLSECWMAANLMEKENGSLKNSTTHQLMGGPTPATTETSAPYQSGFEWNFDGWITGGNGLESPTPTPLQEGGWTWNNVQEPTAVEGLDILNNSEGGTPSWGLRIYTLPEKRDMQIPAISTGDLTFHCTWIWGVPQAVDDSTDRYYMNVNLIPRYLWHWSLMPENKIETSDISAGGDSSHTFMIIPPSRVDGQRINM